MYPLTLVTLLTRCPDPGGVESDPDGPKTVAGQRAIGLKILYRNTVTIITFVTL
jgi:hypothetical protein